MKYKIAWVGLADKKYWEYIAQYCVPSWEKLPGDKFIITDDLTMCSNDFAKLIDLNEVKNHNAQFLNNKVSKKTVNFWKKMQTQRWAVSELKDYDFVILTDTDIEILDFDLDKFYSGLKNIRNTDKLWGVGFKKDFFDDSVDSGFIVVNMCYKDVDTAFEDYENYWESGKVFDLKKSYDGNVIGKMIFEYPTSYFYTKGYGDGHFVYDLGMIHWGGKLPKQIRKELKTDVYEYVQKLTALNKN